VYGKWAGLGWIASITDGSEERSLDDTSDKALSAKLYGSAAKWIDLSASVLSTGDAEESAIEFGGSHIEPVGTDDASTAGTSPSETVKAWLYEFDAHLHAGTQAHLDLAVGGASIDDEVDAFDRELQWFIVQPRYDFSSAFYAVLRWSEIGTFDSDEGYHFDGKIIADGNAAVGYDARAAAHLVRRGVASQCAHDLQGRGRRGSLRIDRRLALRSGTRRATLLRARGDGLLLRDRTMPLLPAFRPALCALFVLARPSAPQTPTPEPSSFSAQWMECAALPFRALERALAEHDPVAARTASEALNAVWSKTDGLAPARASTPLASFEGFVHAAQARASDVHIAAEGGDAVELARATEELRAACVRCHVECRPSTEPSCRIPRGARRSPAT
jgi:hypothetical protein